mgnify:FL=1
MDGLYKSELVPLRKCLEEFIQGLKVEEIPYFYRFIENMKYNLEICCLVQYEGWEQLEKILKRDWKAANHMLLGIPGFDIHADNPDKRDELNCRFLELVSNVEQYLKEGQG